MSYFWRQLLINPSPLCRARTQGKRFGPRGCEGLFKYCGCSKDSVFRKISNSNF
jgi:hypothetical protein